MKLVELADPAKPSELAKLMELEEIAEQVELEELAELVERTETTNRNIRVCDCPFGRSNRQLPCAAGRAEQADSLHRSTRAGMQHVDVDCVEMHPFAAPPTSDEFLRASLRSAQPMPGSGRRLGSVSGQRCRSCWSTTNSGDVGGCVLGQHGQAHR